MPRRRRSSSRPALEITNAWRAAAIPVGIGLMLLAALLPAAALRLAASRSLLAIGLTAAARRCCSGSPARLLKPLGKLNLVVFFVGVVALNVFAGVPIAFSFALATFGYLALTTSTPMIVMVGRLDEGMSPSHPARGAALHLPRRADRDDRHGPRHDPVPRQPARPCPRRPLLCADRRDVSGLRHLRLEDRRHGGDRAGAVPGDEEARRQARRSRRAARRPPARRPRRSRPRSC